MGIKDTKNGKLLYHLTRFDNLESIIENGLVSRKILNDNSAGFSDVANQEIINKRSELGLDSLTPFHFHPYSSFDVAVKNAYSNEEFVYICITRELAKHNSFKILPMHPLSIEVEKFQLLDYGEGFDKIDWNTMHTLGTMDEYTKHVKMAECLTHLVVPAALFHSICVSNQISQEKVRDLLREKGITKNPPYVNVQSWF
ncbi:DarT ssDNA thymidine ADP-ribosyltransferase family protein [Priestia megaterium]|uniref:DarT ssDNA thymidine ADP-ribosyltransferase family protein n=1 Tax=Priestia megaterium TaxID=1404 RepID=UPI0028775698|nr:DarT ssDNA thymidine ADP-ribosyltransferase family protein [Priestia megaterium]MBX4164572.1 DUF4433 domain-containing protein [Priestia megaterium]